MTYANFFPDHSPYLLIAHGGQDENVHFAHTASLLQRLDALGKPYQLSVRTLPTNNKATKYYNLNSFILFAVLP